MALCRRAQRLYLALEADLEETVEKALWPLLTFGHLLSMHCSFRVFFGKS